MPEDPRLEKAFQILKDAGERNECDTFGMFVGSKLKQYTAFTKSYVQHAISNILYNADMGYYDRMSNNTVHYAPEVSPVVPHDLACPSGSSHETTPSPASPNEDFAVMQLVSYFPEKNS